MYRIIVHEVLSVGWGLGFEDLLVGGFRKKDGLLLKSGGDDEEGGWIPAYDLRG
jgi:hypothetical protein